MANPLRGKTFKRTLVVGLGSTGLKILNALQDLWYENFNNTDTYLIKLINIETDEGNKPQIKPSGTMINRIFIQNSGMRYDTLVEKLSRTKKIFKDINYLPWDWSWAEKISWQSLKPLSNSGAGGIRAGGRFLLYAPDKDNRTNAEKFVESVKNTLLNEFKNIYDQNEETAKAIFKSLGQDVKLWVENSQKQLDKNDGIFKSVDNPHFEDEKKKVIVVGSLTGGTCSGMFIDIAYLLQNILGIGENELSRIYGIFLLPPDDLSNFDPGRTIEKDLAYANAFGAIYDLIRFKDLSQQRDRKVRLPYGYVYLVAPEYNTSHIGDRFKNLNGIVEMVAHRIFVNILGYQYKFDADVTDKFLKDNNLYFFTFGIGTVMYPKGLLVDMVSSDLIENVCRAFTDHDNIRSEDGKKIKIPLNAIKNVTSKIVVEISDQMYQILTHTPAAYQKSFRDELDEWRKKLYEDMEGQKIPFFREFKRHDGFFNDGVEANKKGLLKRLSNYLSTELVKELRNYFNIYVLRLEIDYILKELKRLKKLWELQGIHNFDPQKEIINMITEYNNSIKITSETDKKILLRDLMQIIFDRFILNKAYDSLEELEKLLKQWQKKIDIAVDFIRKNAVLFRERYENCKGKLETDLAYAPIIKMYNNDKEKDFSKLKWKLLGENDIIPGWEHLGQYNPDQIWSILMQEKFANELENIKNHFVEKLNIYSEEILQKANFDIFEKAEKDITPVTKMFANVRSCFVKRKKEKDFYVNLPHNVVTDTFEKTGRDVFIDKLQINNLGKEENPLFKHKMFYTRDIPIDIENLESYETMKKYFLSPEDPKLKTNDWSKLRLAYSSEIDFTIIEREKYNEINKIIEFVKLFGFKCTPQPGQISPQFLIDQSAPLKLPHAQLSEKGEPRTEGIHINIKSQPYLTVINKSSNVAVSIDLNNPQKESINKLCQYEPLYNSLVDFFKVNVNFNESNFLEKLRKHYLKMRECFNYEDPQQEYERVFSPIFEPDQGMKIDNIKMEDCLIADVYNILYKIGE